MDQETGEDLNLTMNKVLVGGEVQEGGLARNPDRPSNMSTTILDNDGTSGRGTTRMTSPEKWEIKQVPFNYIIHTYVDSYNIKKMAISLCSFQIYNYY